MTKQKASKTARREYTKEFKLDAVNLVRQQGIKCPDAARDLGINSNLLSRWLRESEGMKPAKVFPGKGNTTEGDEKLRELEKQVRRLTMERDILKKAMAFFVDIPK